MLAATRRPLEDRVRHFEPAWFAVIMGTGSISILFQGFPYGSGSNVMNAFSALFFFLNLVILLVVMITSVIRYLLFPDVWFIMMRHPVQSLYLGCLPMGFTTLLNVSVSLFYKQYGFGGTTFLYAIWGFWWINNVTSILCCWGLVHVMATSHDHSLSQMSPVWLLPVVTLIVASSSGGVLAQAIGPVSPSHALLTITFSIFLVSVGLSLALMILTIYLYRMILYGPPQDMSVISTFVPLGPTGQAGFSIILIGENLKELLPVVNSSSPLLGSTNAGDVVYTVCICIAFILWSLATMWLVFALLSIQSVVRKTRFPFRIRFWGMIFPNGVYANLTITFYRVLDARFFRVWGAVYAVLTFAVWSIVFTRTVMMVRTGEIFAAPCLEDIEMVVAGDDLSEREKSEGEARRSIPQHQAAHGSTSTVPEPAF